MTVHTLSVFVLVLVVLRSLLSTRRRGAVRVRLMTDQLGNEAMITTARISGAPAFFMVDTAYAGAPVLSTSYLSLRGTGSYAMSDEERYRLVVDGLRGVTADERHAAVRRFLTTNTCRSYTSGCTMRLMGIGSTTETQTDMILCDNVRFDNADTFSSDVFVTHPLQSSVHILTMDSLLHRSPCVIMPAKETMLWHVNSPLLRASFEFHTPTYVGGAMRVTMRVGGADLEIVVDTGAAAPLSIAASTIDRIRTCERPAEDMRALQRGVNGEDVCSDRFLVEVAIGQIDLGRVEAFANSIDVTGADGYAGLGLLRMLDMWISPERIGFRRSGLPSKSPKGLSRGACASRPVFRCASGGSNVTS